MSDNLWNQQNLQENGHIPSGNNGNGKPRTGNLLSGYREQQQQQLPQPSQPPQQQRLGPYHFSPPSMPPTQGPPEYSPLPPNRPGEGPAPYSPFPPSAVPQQNQQQYPQQVPAQNPQQLLPQQGPSSPPDQQQARSQHWVANTMQTMRRWSGRVAAVPNVDQNPLVRYRPPVAQPRPLPPTLPRSKRWKRSRTIRIALQMKHRRERWKKARPKKGKIWGGVFAAQLLLIIILASGGTAYGYGYYQSQLPLLQGLANRQINQTTHIYDRNGLLLYDLYDTSLGGGRSTPVAF